MRLIEKILVVALTIFVLVVIGLLLSERLWVEAATCGAVATSMLYIIAITWNVRGGGQ